MSMDFQWTYTLLLIGNDNGASGSRAVIDQSSHAYTVVNPGEIPAQVFFSTSPAPPEGMETALFFPNADSVLAVSPFPGYWEFGNADFCIEGYALLVEDEVTVFADNAGRVFKIARDGNDLKASLSGDGTSWTLLNGVVVGLVPSGWFHFAVYRIGGKLCGAIGGEVEELATVPTSYRVATTNSEFVMSAGRLGALCSVRVTLGHGRYPTGGTFTPPALPLPAEGEIIPPPPPILFSRLKGQVGQPFVYQVNATGEPTLYSAPAGLPPGLELDPTTGSLSGVPTQAGSYQVELTATNAGGESTCAANLLITIDPLPPPVPHITSPLTDTAYQGEPYAYQITATNFPESFNATEMPTGLSIDTQTGLITGAPISNPGLYNVPISATNEFGTTTETLHLTLNPARPPALLPVITSPDTASGTVGNPFTYVIEARNYPTSFYATGLPDGLQVNTQTGSIIGIPREVGTFHVELTATNESGTGTMTLVLSIAPTPAERPCPPPPFVKSTAGPDVPDILCYIPDGCCGPLPCDIDEASFICQVRSLLPEGEPYNNTAEPIAIPAPQYGAITVGCAKVGCEQLIMGGCCGLDVIPCQVDPVSPQLALVDAFGAAAYRVVQALCEMLLELDPCTARQLIRKWAERMGITHPDPCGPGWSDRILVFLICFLTQLRYNPSAVNWDFISYVASRMGAEIKMRFAGDMNGVANSDEPYLGGWWTMARDAPVCPPRLPCPPDPKAELGAEYDQIRGGQMLGEVACAPPNENSPLSLNIVICPSDITIPDNCNLPVQQTPLPHDPEMYHAFWWLLPQMLPRGPLYCIYECCPADCVV